MREASGIVDEPFLAHKQDELSRRTAAAYHTRSSPTPHVSRNPAFTGNTLMSAVLPGGFLFRYQLEAARIATAPGREDPLPALDKLSPLPDLHGLSPSETGVTQSSFASVWLAWHDTGLAVQLVVRDKNRPARCLEASPDASDGLTVWIDTRNTQTIHRASRFCHAFTFLPTGGGAGGDEPVSVPRPIARAREDAPPPPPDSLRVASQLPDDGYSLQGSIAATALHGWDTETIDAIGFTYRVHDNEMGDQALALGEEFPFDRDPSLWSVLTLSGAAG